MASIETAGIKQFVNISGRAARLGGRSAGARKAKSSDIGFDSVFSGMFSDKNVENRQTKNIELWFYMLVVTNRPTHLKHHC